MKKIRIGKDIQVKWTILTNGKSEDLSGRDLTLFLFDPLKYSRQIPFEVSANVISFTVRGTEQRRSGVYSLSLWENYGGIGQSVVDCCEAFQLVSVTCQESPDVSPLSPVELTMPTANIEVAIPGLSAYEVAVKNGFVGTEQEWLASLKGEPFTYEDFTEEQINELKNPAIEAAEKAEEATKKANEAATKAENASNDVTQLISSAESILTEVESATEKAKEATLNADNATATAIQVSNEVKQTNSTVIANETARNLAENERSSAEQERVKSEQQRIEDYRQLKEQASQTISETESAKSEANTAAGNANTAAQNANNVAGSVAELETAIEQKEQSRNLAENARVLAEQDRESSEQQRQKNEQSREKAEEGRNTSETERQQAEQSREKAETLRVSEFNTLKQSAETATGKANTAAQKADTAAENANTAAQNANQAAENIQAELDKKQDALISGENIKSINGESVVGSGNVVINPTIMDLKWTTNIATTRKLVPTELRAKDVRIAYTNSGVYIVEKYKAESIDDASWADNANWKGCRTPLTPLFENAGAKFNDETGFYEMNGLIDLTENDLFIAWSYPRYSTNRNVECSFSCFTVDSKRLIRTNFPFVTFFRSSAVLNLYGQTDLEVFTTASIVKGNEQPFVVTEFTLYACNNIKKFLGIIDVLYYTKNIKPYGNKDLALLEEMYLRYAKVDVSIFKNSPYIIYDCIKYLIDNASNTQAITITVHPTTYGYLTGSIEPTEQVGGTTEEWQQILADAAEKQISFATE